MSNLVLAADKRAEHNQNNATQDRERLFNDLFCRYENDIRRYAYWLAGDKPTADDLVQ